jgi:hypothetical protein
MSKEHVSDGKDCRLTVDEFEVMANAATYLVNDHGKRKELFRLLASLIVRECQITGIDFEGVYDSFVNA